jgi:hypothetical protein
MRDSPVASAQEVSTHISISERQRRHDNKHQGYHTVVELVARTRLRDTTVR